MSTRNKPQKKLNPQQVADSIVKEQLFTIGENFKEIFKRLDANRHKQGPPVGLGEVSLTTMGTLYAPAQFQVSLPVTGKKPVMVGLSANVAPFNTGAQTAGGIHIFTTTPLSLGAISTFYLLADGVSFWGTVLGYFDEPLAILAEYHYFGSPAAIIGFHYPKVPGIVQYSLQFDNFLANQTTDITGVHLFASELF